MFYELKCAAEQLLEILKGEEFPVYPDKNWERDFKTSFVKHYNDMQRHMDKINDLLDERSKPMDAHKLAAVSIITILLVRPINNYVKNKKNEYHYCNEYVAFDMARRIIRNDQISRICKGDDSLMDKVRDSLVGESKFIAPLPPTISDSSSVLLNTIRVLSASSRAITSCLPKDVSWLLSSFLYYVDVYSEKEVMEIAEAIV